MPVLLLFRHGENDYVKNGKIAGRLPGVHLNTRGKQQATAVAQCLATAPIKAIYSSPLERAVETAQPLALVKEMEIIIEPALTETDMGNWQGRSWKVLSRQKIWRIVQHAPARMRFPEGETFYQTQTRIVDALDKIISMHKPNDLIVLVFHSDPIKLAVAHYLGLPLDYFQRLSVDTGSITALSVTDSGARLLWLNRRPPFEFPISEKNEKRIH